MSELPHPRSSAAFEKLRNAMPVFHSEEDQRELEKQNWHIRFHLGETRLDPQCSICKEIIDD